MFLCLADMDTLFVVGVVVVGFVLTRKIWNTTPKLSVMEYFMGCLQAGSGHTFGI